MKKKRFYKDKNRNQSWTEPETGRPIDFAEKYAEGDGGSDKFDYLRPKKSNDASAKAGKQRAKKRLVIALICIAIVCVGYIGADVYMIRHAEPLKLYLESRENQGGDLSGLNISFASMSIPSISLDNSVMLSSVIEEVHGAGYTSVAFEAKRADGTIGYASSLAAVDTFGAISAQASQPNESASQLLSNDILPIARISCYRDNVAPALSAEMALMSGESLYKDSDGYTYLNPDSEAAYGYIKDIVQELNSCGITVFILSGCSLPEDISDGYNDGFEAISEKLSRDLGGNIKLLEEVDVTLEKADASELPSINTNQVYYISTDAKEASVMSALSSAGVEAYILES